MTIALDLRPTTENEHACADCGLPVTGGPENHLLTHDTGPSGMNTPVERELILSLCPACTARHEAAARLLDAHPAVRRRLGSRSIGVYRISIALHALAIAGTALPDRLTDEHILGMIDRLAVPGGISRWQNRVWPSLGGIPPATCSQTPWSWLDPEQRGYVRSEVARWLGDRLPPVAHPCPGGGCGWCGLATVTALRSAHPWTRTMMTPASLGGRGPDRLEVWLCPTCEAAHHDQRGITGALLDYLDPGRRRRAKRPEEPHLNGVIGWAVSGAGLQHEQWSHLDVRGVNATLDRADW